MPNGNGAWWKNLPSWVQMVIALVGVVSIGAVLYFKVDLNTEHRLKAEPEMARIDRRLTLVESQLATLTKLDANLDQQGKDIVQIRIIVERMAEKLEGVAAEVKALRDDRRK